LITGEAMFGYVTINPAELDEGAKHRYQMYYCGLCRALLRRHGHIGQLTLSYDMTFLLMLLSSLYEPEETVISGRCLPHPVNPREAILNEFSDYCADMNIALAYHKCKDDWEDDRSQAKRAQMKLMTKAYQRVEADHPAKCGMIAGYLKAVQTAEGMVDTHPDALSNLTAEMLGGLYVLKHDQWEPQMRIIGQGLGRFIYLMDAVEDLKGDMKHNRFNPLKVYRDSPHFSDLCKDSLTLMIAETAEAFEVLPLVKDVDILRNILYSGVWARYQRTLAKPSRQDEKMKERT